MRYLLYVCAILGVTVSVNAQPFQADDYPPEARRLRQEGRVLMHLTIDKRGRVVACEIKETSNSPSLDKASCEMTRTRARFAPVLDDKGKPIDTTYDMPITWKLDN